MKAINKYIICGLMLMLLIAVDACKKNDETAPDPTIEVNIQSPVEAAVYQQGDTIRINIAVTSPVELHGYEWKIKNKTDNTELASGADHVHSKSFTITGNYVNNVAATTEAEMEVILEVDHEGNERRKTVSFTLNQ